MLEIRHIKQKINRYKINIILTGDYIEYYKEKTGGFDYGYIDYNVYQGDCDDKSLGCVEEDGVRAKYVELMEANHLRNVNLNTRMAYVYWIMSKKKNGEFDFKNFDTIGPALEIFIDWYKKRQGSTNGTITGQKPNNRNFIWSYW